MYNIITYNKSIHCQIKQAVKKTTNKDNYRGSALMTVIGNVQLYERNFYLFGLTKMFHDVINHK